MNLKSKLAIVAIAGLNAVAAGNVYAAADQGDYINDLKNQGFDVKAVAVPGSFYGLQVGAYDVSSKTGAVKNDCRVHVLSDTYTNWGLTKKNIVTDCVFNAPKPR